MTQIQAVIATLSYHDIFDYPLKLDELYEYQIGVKASPNQVKKAVLQLVKESKVVEKEGLYSLKNRPKTVNLRKKRQTYSKEKIKKALIYAKVLKLIPSLQLVAISGALAMQNSPKNDDIDFVLVSAKGALWTTRLLANLLLWPIKRDPSGKKISNRACLNIFIEESALKIKEQNLYTAHEVIQMKLLWDRDHTYQKFMNVNSWIKKYLPNWTPNANHQPSNAKRQSNPKALVARLEAPAKWVQLAYMRRKITTEKIGDRQLFFHPEATQSKILARYSQKLKNI